MARKKKHEEHENLERWLVSYADFITLLFAFFVVMYSLSAINEGKFRVLAESLAAAFRALPRSHEPIQLGKPLKRELVENQAAAPPLSAPIVQAVQLPGLTPLAHAAPSPSAGPGEGRGAQAMRELARRLEQALAPLIEKRLIIVRRTQYWLEVEIKTNILFPSGSAELEPAVLPVLKQIAAILRDYPNPVRVEGFTDNVPIQTPIFPSNWELSAARATRVVRLFAEEGVDPARLAAVGHGEFKPVAPNDTEEGRARNRKVVIVVLSEDASRLLNSESQQAGAGGGDDAVSPRASEGPTGAGGGGTATEARAPPLALQESAQDRFSPATLTGADRSVPPPAGASLTPSAHRSRAVPAGAAKEGRSP
jgi:chemotaxis protein MotB